jgi:hypothetical protein
LSDHDQTESAITINRNAQADQENRQLAGGEVAALVRDERGDGLAEDIDQAIVSGAWHLTASPIFALQR